MDRLPHPAVLDLLARAGSDGVALSGVEAAGIESLAALGRAGFPVRCGPERASLDDDGDCLVGELIRREVVSAAVPEPLVHGYLEVDSTNSVGLELCRAGAPHWTLIHAECQHAGRGRLGRIWSSPARLGLYFSLILRPRRDRGHWPLLSMACGWAVAAGVGDLAPVRSGPGDEGLSLKWPNDVNLAGRKVAGILLENCTAAGSPGGAVAGIGINVRSSSAPPGLEITATTLEQQGILVPRRRLLVAVIRRVHEVFELFEQGSDDALVERWSERSAMHKDCPVWVGGGDRRRAAVTGGIDRSGGLQVRYEDGTVATLVAGEVSIRRRDELP